MCEKVQRFPYFIPKPFASVNFKLERNILGIYYFSLQQDSVTTCNFESMDVIVLCPDSLMNYIGPSLKYVSANVPTGPHSPCLLSVGALQSGGRRNLVMRPAAGAVKRQRCSMSWRTSYPCPTASAPIWTRLPS